MPPSMSIFGSADPVSVVLLFAAGGGLADLRERLAARSRRVAVQLETMASERERLTAQGLLSPLAVAAFRRGELRLEAELRWHEEFESKLAAGGRARGRDARRAGRVRRGAWWWSVPPAISGGRSAVSWCGLGTG